MAKPVITFRNTKGAALTYSELDTNFQNLRDSTLSLVADTGGATVTADLNGQITIVAGSGITITGDNTAKTLTITGNSQQNVFSNIAVAGQSTIQADSSTDTLTVASSGSITLTTNSTTDTLTISCSASGTVNTGTAGFFAYYPNNGDVVDDLGSLRYNSSSGYLELWSDLNLRGKIIRDSTGNPQINDDLYFITNSTGPVGAGVLVIRNRASYDTRITLDGSNIVLDGALKVSAITGTPANTSTPTGYLQVVIGTTTRYIPYYT